MTDSCGYAATTLPFDADLKSKKELEWKDPIRDDMLQNKQNAKLLTGKSIRTPEAPTPKFVPIRELAYPTVEHYLRRIPQAADSRVQLIKKAKQKSNPGTR